MAKNEAKVRFTAETGDFNKSIKAANSEMSKLRAEMRLNAEQMEDTGATVDGLKKKQKLLSDQLEASEQKTEALRKKLEKAKEIFGENSDEVRQLEIQLSKAQVEQIKLERAVAQCTEEIEQHESASEQLSREIEEQRRELELLKRAYSDTVLEYGKTSKEAKELEGKIGKLSSEIKTSTSKMQAAKGAADKLDRSLDDAGRGAENAGEGFTILKGAVADLISDGIQAAIGKINEFVDYLRGLPEETREIRQDFATLETAFSNVGLTTEQATNTWKELYKVFGEDDRAVEAANNIARMSKNQQDLDSWVRITTGIWGTYQDSLPVEGLAEAAGETAKTGKVTGGLADALNWSSEAAEMFSKYMSDDVVTAEDAFNEALAECNTEQERQQLITETLTKLYGGAADEYNNASGSMIAAKDATSEQILAENNLAKAIEPVTTLWQEMKNELLVGILPAVEKVSGAMIDALEWMREHPVAMKVIAGVLGVVAAAITALTIVVVAWTVAQWALNSAILANPITWIIVGIVAAIAAVVAIVVVVIEYWDEIVAAVKKCVDWICKAWNDFVSWIDTNLIQPVAKFFVDLWNGIVDGVKAAWDWIVNLLSSVGNWIWNNVIKPVLDFYINLYTSIWNGLVAAWNWVVDLCSTVATWFYDNVIKPVAQFFVDLWNGIVNAYHTVVDPWIEIVKRISVIIYEKVILPVKQFFVDLWNGIVSGLQSAWTWITTLVSTVATWIYENVIRPVYQFYVDLWTGIINGVKSAWDWIVNLAVTVAGWVNENVIQPVAQFFVNLWNGIVNGVNTAIEAVKNAFNAVVNFINTKVIQPVTNFFKKLWDGFTNGAKKAWEGVKSVFSKVGQFFSNVFNTVKDKIVSVFQAGGKVFNNIKEGIVNVFKTVVNGIITGINKVISIPFNGLNGILDKIHNITIVGVKPFEWLTWRAPVPQIPQLAEGGILTQPTLNIAGEAGPEAVIPLDRLQSFIDNAVDRSMQANNMQALVLAIEDLADRAIELNVNGQRFATATAADTDRVNGNRAMLTRLGLALG